MSLEVTLSENKTIITQPEESQTLSGNVQINRIVDIPAQRQVNVFVEGIGRIELDELSGDNYDTPAEWTNADVQTAVLNWINANLSS
tara:strand:- start:3 stop:263 length:261 start_codon:yes stop_codon:yes gene_type:complete